MVASKTPISNLMQKLQAGDFVFTGEIVPGRSIDIDPLVDEAAAIEPYVTAANIPDIRGSFVGMNGLAIAARIQEKNNLELVFQLTCRDLNRLRLASVILGANALGIKNFLTLTGDDTTLGDIPDAKPVFDLDSAQLLQLAREMVDNQTIYGLPIEESDTNPVRFHVGIGANPNTDHFEAELMKIERKIELGAEFIQTQVVFDLEKAEPFFSELNKFGIPVLMGIFPMKNYTIAKEFDSLTAGIHVPPEILSQFKAVSDNNNDMEAKHEAYDQINIDLYAPMIEELKQKRITAGVHIIGAHYSRIYPKLIL
jgi:5,10-methylenetetrahydrofolate reductase